MIINQGYQLAYAGVYGHDWSDADFEGGPRKLLIEVGYVVGWLDREGDDTLTPIVVMATGAGGAGIAEPRYSAYAFIHPDVTRVKSLAQEFVEASTWNPETRTWSTPDPTPVWKGQR